MLPQLIKTFKKKKSEEISILMIICLITGIGLWIYYGVLKNDLPIIITNSFSFIVNCVLLIFHFKYKKEDAQVVLTDSL
ncbi:MAG: SemiSWEET family transporter [Bacteroidota bacterium]|nr:SemiSWEET family transporter [Bacteroidota bacterium]